MAYLYEDPFENHHLSLHPTVTAMSDFFFIKGDSDVAPISNLHATESFRRPQIELEHDHWQRGKATLPQAEDYDKVNAYVSNLCLKVL